MWEMILKYSGLVGIAISSFVLIRSVLLDNRKLEIYNPTIFAFAGMQTTTVVCLELDVTNPSTRPVPLFRIGIAPYDESDTFLNCIIDEYLILGYNEKRMNATTFPITISPGETKHIIASFRLFPDEAQRLNYHDVYAFKEIRNSIRLPLRDRIMLIWNDREPQNTSTVNLRCQIQSRRNPIVYDLDVLCVDPRVKMFRMSDRAALEKSFSNKETER